ncbi:winged helix-turn-helix domain-containing protein [Methanobacterium alkalithermotolerans]|uniref:winged helix-turn-helix domain-containing protein n=1 Tax=Methanobacterium alkalithermotolerans TaxID=2731220 RepID=UPI001B8CCE24|nr:winged helix-turn-helix domain-containing protein [Methanobacterium alkalithermotolerans]
MPIPDYQSIMLPFLKLAGDKKEHSMRNTFEQLANQFQLTEEEKNDLLPSGTQPIFENRVGWARTYLKKAGLVESRKRGYFNITGEGLKVLEQSLDKIDVDFLMQFPDFVKFRAGNKKNVPKKLSGKN